MQKNTYGWYLAKQAHPDLKDENIVLPASDAIEIDGDFEWPFIGKNAGRYYLKVKYQALETTLAEIERGIAVNGETPYKELESFSLPKEYKDAAPPKKDIYGNEIRPEQVNAGHILENYIFDYAGVYSEPLSINVEKGQNTLLLIALNGLITVEAIILEPAGNIPPYKNVKEGYGDIEVYSGGNIVLEAERASYKSDSTLCPINDQSSPLVSRIAPGKINLNTIGGERWKTANQYITWTIPVPKTGLYTLSFKARQNINGGQKSSRILYINGQIPFEEAKRITIPFSTDWQIVVPGNDREAYLFYLKKGENEIRLQATLGETDRVLRMLDYSVLQLNQIYRSLLMVIGPVPDTARDYNLDKLVPASVGAMKTQADILEECADRLEGFNGAKNSGSGLIRTMVRQLKEFNDDSDRIPSQFSYFKTNIGALATWLSIAKQQPLELDFLIAGNEKNALPKANADIFSQAVFEITKFIYSFMIDYKNIGELESGSDYTDSIRVWISSGRDQAQVIRSMISDHFTPQNNIKVKLELVSPAALLPATVAGIGPDISLGNENVINFAMRNAVYNLRNFRDFDEVSQRFYQVLFIPLAYMGGIYGLPEKIAFPVLFYRTDIFEELGLDVPRTWEDVIAMSSILTKNNMSFGLPGNNQMLLNMFMQNGVGIYKDNGVKCLLNSVKAITTFQRYTGFYTNYGFPITYDFVNRFRSGEIPAAVTTFNSFNNLQIAAPEIKGLWKFALIPGTIREDKTVDHTSLASGSAAVILQKCKNKESAWKFIKWWTSEKIQTRFGKEIESLLGPSARYSSANREAFSQSSWSKEDAALLNGQMKSLNAVEQVPGGYFLTRHLDNAFRNVVYSKRLPMDVMYDYVYKINRELTEKRKEFGLNTEEQR